MHYNLEYLFLYKIASIAVFVTKLGSFVNFPCISPVFKLFFKSKRVFALVLQTESRHFQILEDKANAHAGMPFCSVSRFVVTGFSTGLWSSDQGQQPVWGVGRLRLSFRGSREPRMDKCNDLRLFCFLQNLA